MPRLKFIPLLLCLVVMVAFLQAVIEANASTGTEPQSEPTIDKTSVQVTTQEHRSYFSEGKEIADFWSWTPRIDFRVNGPIPAGSQLQAEFFLPGGKSWLKLDCATGEIGPGQWWQVGNPSCGNNLPDEQGIIYTGPMDFKIYIRNELQGTSKTLFAGKMNVKKVHVTPDLPVNKNHFDFFIDHDWNLPIGYVFAAESDDDSYADFAPLGLAMWFRGETNNVAAYLFYKGQEISNTATSTKGTSNQEVSNLTFEDSPFQWRRMSFTFFNVLAFNREDPDNHPSAFRLDRNPGEYEVKVLRGGKLIRTARFQVGADGRIVDNGVARNNNLGTKRMVMPVQVIGSEGPDHDPNSWKAGAFYGNPLSGFSVQ
jgi:hypothetical protein